MNFRRDIGYSGRGYGDINRKPPTAEQSIPSVYRACMCVRYIVGALAMSVCGSRSTMRPADPRRYERAKCNRGESIIFDLLPLDCSKCTHVRPADASLSDVLTFRS